MRERHPVPQYTLQSELYFLFHGAWRPLEKRPLHRGGSVRGRYALGLAGLSRARPIGASEGEAHGSPLALPVYRVV